MCGIVAGFSKKGKRISKSVMKRYTAQKHRGSQGFGYVAFYKDGQGGRISIGRSTEENAIRTQIMNEHSSMVMFHHRLPTSTPNVVEATHPIYVSHEELDYDYFVVHNGVIKNASELRTKHENLKYVYNTVIETELVTHHTAKKTGHKYYTGGTKSEKFNDSEALAIELARYLDGMTHSIDAVGTVATIAWKVNKETGRLVSISYGHNAGNPLTISENKDHFFLTSIGGTDIPEDVMYTLHTDGDKFGTTSQVEISVGYNTEYAKTNKSNSYKWTYNDYKPPALPDPKSKTSINDDVKAKHVDKSSKEYFESVYGYSNTKRLKWDKEEESLKKIKVGFTNEGNELEEDERVDTTTEYEGNYFMEKSSSMVDEYLELEDLMDDVKADMDTAEMLLKGNNDLESIKILTDDIKLGEEKIQALQEKMNGIEDMYMELFPSRPSFRGLLEAYDEQETDGVLYDIQMEDERQYELSKHF